MDILDLLKKKLAPVFPQAMQPPAMDSVQHEGVIAAGGDSLTMDGGATDGSGTSALGASLGAGLMGMATGKGAATQPVEAEKQPLGQASDLSLRKPEALPMPPDFSSQAHGSSNMAPAAAMPGIAPAPAAAPPIAPEGEGGPSAGILGGLGSGLKSLGGGLASNIGGDAMDLMKMFRFGGARRYGGPVDPHKKYLVGENGPEMFVPEQEGTIVPNGDDTSHLPQSVQAEQIPLGTQVSPQQQQPVPEDPKAAQAQNPVATMVQQPPVQPLSPRQKLERELAEIEGKDYSIKKVIGPDGQVIKIRGKDRDSDHNILDVLKGIGIGALKGGAQNGLAGMIAGAATGGISAGFDRNYDEKFVDEFKAEGLRGKLNTVREGEMADAKIAEQTGKADNQRREYGEGVYKNTEAALAADGVIDGSDSMILTSLRKRLGMIGEVPRSDKRKVETKIINGEVWEREADGLDREWKKADAPSDPTKTPVYTTSPMTGQRVAITPQDLYSGESTMAASNAQRQQSAETTNVNNDLSAQKENVSNLQAWQAREVARRTKAIEEFGKNLENLGEAQVVNAQIQKLNQEMQQLAQAGDVEGFTAKEEEFKALTESFDKSLKKTQAGTQLVEMLAKTGEPRPKTVAAKKVNASQVSAKVVSQSDLDAFAKSQKWSPDQAAAYAKKNGWTIR